jgi:hypothetical protein
VITQGTGDWVLRNLDAGAPAGDAARVLLWATGRRRARASPAGPVGSGRAGYGTKMRPLGVTAPLTATLPTAPVFRLIVPRELAG